MIERAALCNASGGEKEKKTGKKESGRELKDWMTGTDEEGGEQIRR